MGQVACAALSSGRLAVRTRSNTFSVSSKCSWESSDFTTQAGATWSCLTLLQRLNSCKLSKERLQFALQIASTAMARVCMATSRWHLFLSRAHIELLHVKRPQFPSPLPPRGCWMKCVSKSVQACYVARLCDESVFSVASHSHLAFIIGNAQNFGKSARDVQQSWCTRSAPNIFAATSCLLRVLYIARRICCSRRHAVLAKHGSRLSQESKIVPKKKRKSSPTGEPQNWFLPSAARNVDI